MAHCAGIMDQDSVQAWLLCEDLLVRIRGELISEALELLQKEIKEGRVAINGTLPGSQDSGASDTEFFVIRRLIAERPGIMERYSAYVGRMPGKRLDDTEVHEMEELKRFLSAIDGLALLVRLADVFGAWAGDMADAMDMKSVEDVLKATSQLRVERGEALSTLLTDETFLKSGASQRKSLTCSGQ